MEVHPWGRLPFPADEESVLCLCGHRDAGVGVGDVDRRRTLTNRNFRPARGVRSV